MTDIVERLRRRRLPIDVGQFTIYEDDKECHEAADEIEWLRKENQELKLQYLSDQGQWIEETGRLREALDAVHYYIDASDRELKEDGITRDDALLRARELRTALGWNK